jgi:hypothetical protein
MQHIELGFPPQKTSFSNLSIDTTLSYLHDDRSRMFLKQHHEMISNGVYVNNFSQINGTNNCYQHPDVHVEPHDKIISINPMLGRPLKYFVEATKGLCEVHCFEENALQYMQLCKNIIDWKVESQVLPLCNAIYSSTGMLSVDHQGASGHYNTGDLIRISEENRHNVMQAVFSYRIDDYLKQKSFEPTFIECTRPGMAEHILNGALHTIEKHKPKLLLTASPYSDIAKRIKQINTKYQIFYSESGMRSLGIFFAKIESSMKEENE